MNSYKFVPGHSIRVGDKLPIGYMACWEHRHSLALAKLAKHLSVGQSESEWQALLICSDGKNRENDDFIEAHIYGGFNSNAVESLAKVPDKNLTKEDKLDIRIAISKFNRLRREGP